MHIHVQCLCKYLCCCCLLLLLFIVFVYMKVVIAAGHLQDVMMSVISNDEKMQEASVSV